MAKDRARDSRRVPSLGISEPISHVSIAPSGAAKVLGKRKLDSDFNSDADRENLSKANQHTIASANYRKRAHLERNGGSYPTIKIDSRN